MRQPSSADLSDTQISPMANNTEYGPCGQQFDYQNHAVCHSAREQILRALSPFSGEEPGNEGDPVSEPTSS